MYSMDGSLSILPVFPLFVIIEAGSGMKGFLTQITVIYKRGVKVFGLHVVPHTGCLFVGETQAESTEISLLSQVLLHVPQQLAGGAQLQLLP